MSEHEAPKRRDGMELANVLSEAHSKDDRYFWDNLPGLLDDWLFLRDRADALDVEKLARKIAIMLGFDPHLGPGTAIHDVIREHLGGER